MAPATLPTVLFLHPADEMYGADRQLLALVRASRELCRPVVLLPDDAEFGGGLSKTLDEDGVEVHHGPLPVLRRRYGSPAAMARWLPQAVKGWWWVLNTARSINARLVVSNSTAIPVGPSIAMLLRRPHLWFVREVIESPNWFRGLVRASARMSKGHVYTVSDAVGRWLGPIAGKGPSTLHDGVEIIPDSEPIPPRPLALYVGRINEWKGWDVFIDAAVIAHADVPDARFRLAGGVVPGADIDAATIQAALREADASGEWLEWLGELPDALLAMREAWLVAVPSLRPDPFPNVVLEGMTQGRAVIGSDIGGIPEMIVDGETGFVVLPSDAQALAGAMTSVLEDQGLAQRLGSAGHRRVSREFSMSRFEQAWAAILRGALGTHD